MRQQEKKQDNAFAGFGDYIEIFRGGKQTDAGGRVHDGDALIDKAVALFNPAVHEPPVVIGHPADNTPAFGWVESLKTEIKDGIKVLLAKFKQLVPEFEEAVKAGLYKKRSAAFYPDGGLRHVGFLGAVPPAVKGLADVAFKEKAGPVFEIEEQQKQGGAKMNFKEKMKGFLSSIGVDVKKIPDDAIPDQVAGSGQTFSEADVERIKKEAEEEGRQKLQAEFAEQKRRDRKAERDREIKTWCEQRVKEGKLIPAWVEGGLVNFMQNLDAENAIAFSESKKENALAWFKSFLDSFSASPLFKEMAVKTAAAEAAEFSEAKKQEELGKSIAAKVNAKA